MCHISIACFTSTPNSSSPFLVKFNSKTISVIIHSPCPFPGHTQMSNKLNNVSSVCILVNSIILNSKFGAHPTGFHLPYNTIDKTTTLKVCKGNRWTLKQPANYLAYFIANDYMNEMIMCKSIMQVCCLESVLTLYGNPNLRVTSSQRREVLYPPAYLFYAGTYSSIYY